MADVLKVMALSCGLGWCVCPHVLPFTNCHHCSKWNSCCFKRDGDGGGGALQDEEEEMNTRGKF